MTILVVAQTAERVVLGADTRALRFPDGHRFDNPKIFSTMKLAVGSAGSNGVAIAILAAASVSGWDYDEAVKNASALLSDVLARFKAQAAAAGAAGTFEQQHESLVLAGYSETVGRMAACVFSGGGSEPENIEGLAYLPGGTALPSPASDPSSYTDANFMDMARKLAKRCNELKPGTAGGRLHLLSMERDQTMLRDLGEIAAS